MPGISKLGSDARNWQAATCKTVLRAVIAVHTAVSGDDPNANVLLNTAPAERRPLWINFVHVAPIQLLKIFLGAPAHILNLDQIFYGMGVPTVQDKHILRVWNKVLINNCTATMTTSSISLCLTKAREHSARPTDAGAAAIRIAWSLAVVLIETIGGCAFETVV
jgi:hypothetical protein